MTKKYTTIDHIPAIVWGEESDNVYLMIHGQFGSKEDAEQLASIVCPKGWQVLSFDLPEHGNRTKEVGTFDPWHVVPEIQEIRRYMKPRWSKIALYAISIGAWFAMVGFADYKFDQCLFVSPLLDMESVIMNSMKHANITIKELEAKKEILTKSDGTLSWRYLMYARDYAIRNWKSPTNIFYPENDHLTSRDIVVKFVNRFQCQLEVLEDGEHWIHTKEQVAYLGQWIDCKTEQGVLLAIEN